MELTFDVGYLSRNAAGNALARMLMATDKQPAQGMKVAVWAEDGQKVMEGTISEVLFRPATATTSGQTAQITIKADEAPS